MNRKMYMPAEYSRHSATVMIWPVREGSFPDKAREAQRVFAAIARAIAQSEKVYMLYDSKVTEPPEIVGVEFIDIPTDDAWARDVCPTFVTDGCGNIAGTDWRFNAWGGDYDGLYQDYEQDDACAVRLCDALGLKHITARPFVLEGGSVHSDGEGTVITTEECLLSPGRNPSLTKQEIEARLKKYLGADKVIWLPYGIYNDETNGHADNICAFTEPGSAVLAWTDDRDDPQYERSAADLEVLESETDAKGRKFRVTRLPVPSKPVCLTDEQLKGYSYEEGEAERQAGERLAASYVNFYITNGGVIIPQFGDENDGAAVEILQGLFPDRKMYPINTMPVLLGGGNIHCITQQIPECVKGGTI